MSVSMGAAAFAIRWNWADVYFLGLSRRDAFAIWAYRLYHFLTYQHEFLCSWTHSRKDSSQWPLPSRDL